MSKSVKVELSNKEYKYLRNFVETEHIRFDSVEPEIKKKKLVKESSRVVKSLRRKLDAISPRAYSV